MAFYLLNDQEIKSVRQKELDLKSGLQLEASPIFANIEDGKIQFNGIQIQDKNTGVSIDIRYETAPVDKNMAPTSTPNKHYEVAESIEHLFRSESYVQSLLIGVYKLISTNEAGRVVGKISQLTLVEQAVLKCLKTTNKWDIALDGQNIIAQMR